MIHQEPTGTLDGRAITFRRELRAPIAAVWETVTDPEQLQRWIGTWTGDVASGRIVFCMTSDGDDAPQEPMTILECTEPTRLHLAWLVDGETWDIVVELAEEAGVTTVVLQQTFESGGIAAEVGPSWEYYLDRLVALLAGRDVASVQWGAYHPGLSEFYQAMARRIDEAPRAQGD